MTILDELMGKASGISGHEGTLEDPKWHDARLVHDWRNHVLEAVVEAWPGLSLDARVVAYLFARTAASAEEWD